MTVNTLGSPARPALVSIDWLIDNLDTMKSVVLYGFGDYGRFIYSIFKYRDRLDQIAAVVDASAESGAKTLHGVHVSPTTELVSFPDAHIIICSIEHRDAILERLTAEFDIPDERLVCPDMNELELVDAEKCSQMWLEGAREEVFYWERKLANRHFQPGGGKQKQADPEAQFSHEVLEQVRGPQGRGLEVLDVGCGPVTVLGYRSDQFDIKLTIVDPLADEYRKMYDKYQFHPPVLPQKCRGEDLNQMFADQTFDIVFSNNALDHAEDPLRILKNMCELLKQGALLYVGVFENEAEKEAYDGLHQWNFTVDDGTLFLWNKQQRICLDEALQNYGQLRVLQHDAAARRIVFSLYRDHAAA